MCYNPGDFNGTSGVSPLITRVITHLLSGVSHQDRPRRKKNHQFWLVVWTPLKNISQLGWLFPIYGKVKNGNQTTNQKKSSTKLLHLRRPRRWGWWRWRRRCGAGVVGRGAGTWGLGDVHWENVGFYVGKVGFDWGKLGFYMGKLEFDFLETMWFQEDERFYLGRCGFLLGKNIWF